MASSPREADARQLHLPPGLSTADVSLLRDDGRHWIVRKQARSAAGNDRLRRQCTKQQLFAEAKPEGVAVPHVLDAGEADGRFYFDMPFIQGTDGGSFLRQAAYAEVVVFADGLAEFLAAASARPPLGEAPAESPYEATRSRILAVRRACDALGPEELEALLAACETIRGWTRPPTLCHGDLTLENVIITPSGEIWLVDLLDAPFEHWAQDVSKLHQDVDGGWYRRRQPAISRCVLEFLGRRLRTAAERLDPEYARMHWLLLAVHFARILPYVREDSDRDLVLSRVRHFAGLAADVPSDSRPRT